MSNPLNLNQNGDQPPTDSVLRRHYEQLRAAQAAAPVSAAPRPAPAPAAAPPAAATAPAEPEAKGVLGWLGRLFGG